MPTSNKGFHGMDADHRRVVALKGGKSSRELGLRRETELEAKRNAPPRKASGTAATHRELSAGQRATVIEEPGNVPKTKRRENRAKR
jgi:hypothetical protein